jgi:phosphonate transport system substrate-binding protein
VATLRLSGIPDADKDKLSKMFAPVCQYLTQALGVPVEYVHAPDYAAAVAGLAANKLDLVWLGGVTAVQAEQVTGGQAVFVAARDTDLRFKSYFIAHKSLVEAGQLQALADTKPGTLADLAALRPALAGMSFTFGAKSSTSGHIMPRHFLEDPVVGIDPESHFKAKPGYQVQGGHSATLEAVASGAFDVGVLNYTNWDKADPAKQAAAPVIAVTPEYVDYCFVAHARAGEDKIAKLRAALVALDGSRPEHEPVLEAFGASKFVSVDPKSWDGIRAILKSGKDRGVLD